MATRKKTTLDELGEMIRHLVKASADNATKDDLTALEKKLIDRIDGVESKLSGTNRRLDSEAMQRGDLKLPRRVHDLEEEVYGAGRSKHPKHVPF